MGLFSKKFSDFPVQINGKINGNINSHTTITEKRAPTDESLRLLQEMEEKVTDSIVAKIVVPNNLISGTILVLEDKIKNSASDQYKIAIKFKLNDEEYEIVEIVDKYSLEKEYKDSIDFNYFETLNHNQAQIELISMFFYNKVAEIITQKLIRDNTKNWNYFVNGFNNRRNG